MKGKRRLIVTLVGQIFQVLPLLLGEDVTMAYAGPLMLVTIFALAGYNVEDALRLSKNPKELGEVMVEVGEAVIEVAANVEVKPDAPGTG